MKFVILLLAAFSSVAFADFQNDINLDLGGNYTGKIYKDGSGSFGRVDDQDRWGISIQFDQITDEPTVLLSRRPYRTFSHMEKLHKVESKDRIYLTVKFKGGIEEVCVSGHNNFNKNAVFRVDKGEPVYTLKTGLRSQFKQKIVQLVS